MKQGKIQTLYDFETKEAVAPRTVLEAITGTGTEGQVVGFTKDNVIGAMNPPQTGITEEDADNRYLQLSGGTMTGALSVQEPTEDSNATNKGYVDDALQRKSNPNLLDNWYLANPINQKGQTEYTKPGYMIDRWIMQDSYSTGRLSVEDDGVTIYNVTEVSTQGVWFTQYIERYSKGTHTFSFLVDEFEGVGIAVYAGTNNGFVGIIKGTGLTSFTRSENDVSFSETTGGSLPIGCRIVIGFGNRIKIRAIKLEQGDHQTLAHKEGDTWVLNDPPPNPATELAKCQRYQFVLRFPTETFYLGGLYGKALNAGRAVISIPLPVTMRAMPTVSYSGEFRLSDTAIFAGKPPVTSMTMDCINSSNVVINAFTSDILTVGEMYCMVGKNSAETNLILDANL